MSRLEPYRGIICFGVTVLTELFTNAVSDSVMQNVNCPKIARYGAIAGGALIGLKVGDDVADYICDAVEGFLDGLDEVKAAIDQAKEGA